MHTSNVVLTEFIYKVLSIFHAIFAWNSHTGPNTTPDIVHILHSTIVAAETLVQRKYLLTREQTSVELHWETLINATSTKSLDLPSSVFLLSYSRISFIFTKHLLNCKMSHYHLCQQ